MKVERVCPRDDGGDSGVVTRVVAPFYFAIASTVVTGAERGGDAYKHRQLKEEEEEEEEEEVAATIVRQDLIHTPVWRVR